MSEEVNRPEKEYSASSIQVLEGLEAVRKRPAMYIGDIGEKGLHHLVYEVVDNSIDEALAGYCTDIEVTINEDGSVSVRDNGRGIPTDYHEKEGRSALEVVLTVLHAGGKFDKGSYKVSGGLHGVGVSCVNALSTLLIAEVHRDGKIYRETFSKGVPTSKLEIVGECSDRGTTITFKPDGEIFTHTTEYKYEILSNRLRELAFLNKGIQLTITDKRVKDEQGGYLSETFHSKDGLKEFVQYLDATRGEPIIESIIYLDTEKNGVPVEVAMQYNDSFSENVHSYVNNINTIGRHFGEGRRAAVRGADQDQTGQRRGGCIGRSGRFGGAGQLLGGESEGCQGDRGQGGAGGTGAPCGAQGARSRAAQDAAVGRRSAGQAGRLFEPRPVDRRDLLRRG